MESPREARRAELARVEAALEEAVRAYQEITGLLGQADERRKRRDAVRALRKRRDALRKERWRRGSA